MSPNNPGFWVNKPIAEAQVFLSTLPAGASQCCLALAVMAVSLVILAVLAPFATIPLMPLPAFIPIYESALVINDLVTAILLFGQFAILRQRALAVLASAYLFTAFITVAHALTFPGLFAPGGLLGAGPQSTAWLYMLWHGGFPLLVILYALLRKDADLARRVAAPSAIVILGCIAAALAAAGALTALATAGQTALPAIMQGNSYTPSMIGVVSGVWVLSLLAVAVLWPRRRRSVIDLWLIVVICAWLCDIALSAVLNAGRFDLGFYAGRIYGLLASAFVLAVLLLENGVLYSRLVTALDGERRESRRAHQKTVELTLANKEIEAFTYSVSHDLRAPLRAIEGFVRILVEDHGRELSAEASGVVEVVRRNAHRMTQLIDDLLAFSRLGRQAVTTAPIVLDDVVRATIDELQPQYAGRLVDFSVGQLGAVDADPSLLKQVLVNLLGNAVKYTGRKERATIEIGCLVKEGAAPVYFVRDNGAGFDSRHADKLFGVFQRLHRDDEFEGTGVGLAIVQNVINRHGGRIWAEAKPDEGATFYFTLQPEVDVVTASAATAVSD